MKPIVSVVIPNFNNTTLLGELIDCFKKQTLHSWELIIVDDCSTDNSYEYALSYTSDTRIKVYMRDREPKSGQTCRNIGLEKATGKYTIFPTHSFKPREDYQSLHKNDVVWGKRVSSDILYHFLSNDYPYLVVSCIYKKESIRSIKWNEDIPVRQDLVYNLNMLFAGLKFDFCDSAEYDYFYRGAHSANNVSRNMTSPIKYEGMKKVFDFMYGEIEQYTIKQKELYLKGIKRYIVTYANLLVSENVQELYQDFLLYCEAHYNTFFIARLKFANICLKNVSSIHRKEVSWIVFMLLFWHKFYLDLVKKAFSRVLHKYFK